MADKLTKKQRSWNMSRIKSKDTKPEIIVRRLLHKMGFRFRLNGQVSKKYSSNGLLIGKPDIVLAGYKTVVFIHGCFWHRHISCKHASIPKTRTKWWLEKLNKNIERDKKTKLKLEATGWKVLIIWECETLPKNLKNLEQKLKIEILND